MWSYRLNKIKSNHLNKSIANSESRAEKQRDQTLRDSGSAKLNPRYLFHKMAQWQHLIELFIASTGIAKQQDWQMNRAFLSPSYTTKLSDLLTVH